VMHRTSLLRSKLARTAVLELVLCVVNVEHPGNPVVLYLSEAFTTAFNELERILEGTGRAKPLFFSYGGEPLPIWGRVLVASSIALIILSLPFGLLCLWQRYRSNALAVTFGMISLLYPTTQVFRFTTIGSDVAERADAFTFIPVAFLLAIFITQFWPARWLSWRQNIFLASTLFLLFLGGVLLQSGISFMGFPGPYLAIADSRSIEPEGIQAALWVYSYLEPNNLIGADRINQLLMGTYGEQRVVTYKIDLSSVFLSLRLGPDELSLLREAQTRYLVVDLRLARSLPVLGFYYEQTESGAFQHTTPVDMKALTKFSTMPQVSKVFDGGDIVIYDVGGLLNAP